MKDIDIRNGIKSSFLRKYYEDASSRVVEELNVRLGEARIDIAVINGSFHGYEIKSEKDSLIRLGNQLETYSKIFDFLTIVCGECHLENVLKNVPSWCGVIVAKSGNTSEQIRFKKVRPAQKNTSTDKYSVSQLLWKDEVIKALNDINITKGLTGKNKSQLWELLSQSLSEKKLSRVVRETLKLREQWRVESPLSGNDGYFQLSSKS